MSNIPEEIDHSIAQNYVVNLMTTYMQAKHENRVAEFIEEQRRYAETPDGKFLEEQYQKAKLADETRRAHNFLLNKRREEEYRNERLREKIELDAFVEMQISLGGKKYTDDVETAVRAAYYFINGNMTKQFDESLLPTGLLKAVMTKRLREQQH